MSRTVLLNVLASSLSRCSAAMTPAWFPYWTMAPNSCCSAKSISSNLGSVNIFFAGLCWLFSRQLDSWVIMGRETSVAPAARKERLLLCSGIISPCNQSHQRRRDTIVVFHIPICESSWPRFFVCDSFHILDDGCRTGLQQGGIPWRVLRYVYAWQ